MKKILFIVFFILSIASGLCLAQEIENQQINKDEGYGPNDEEYYNAEGVNSEDSKSEGQEHSEHK